MGFLWRSIHQDVGIRDVGKGDLVLEYELFFAFFCICLVDSQEMVFPVMLWCLNMVLNFVMKLAKVPRVNKVPEMALWWKVDAQVRADPLVMYERAKVICFSSVL